MTLARRLALLASIAFVAVGSLAFTHAGDGQRTSVDSAAVRPDSVHPLLRAGDSSVDVGLALSGGGLRAALFSIGVMKALYDAGELQKVDVISSVSGGGYASMWVYRKQAAATSQQKGFGSAAFDQSVFASSLCDIERLGNFHSYPVIARAFVHGDTFDAYEASINRTFGVDGLSNKPVYAQRELIDRGDVPQFVLNASLADTDQLAPRRFDNVVEITPSYIGNARLGYHEWADSDNLAPRWSEAVTVSAAAVSPLQHQLRNWTPALTGPTVRMWDGGRTENLAAFALIRRRVPNIIIVDAEHDPAYDFEGYERLKHLLPSYGLSLEVADIDRHLGNRDKNLPNTREYRSGPVSVGTVRAILPDGSIGPVTSTIRYIKLSVSDSVRRLMESDTASVRIGLAYDKQLEKYKTCAEMSTVNGGFEPRSFLYEVADYWQWSRHRSFATWATRNVPLLNMKGARYQFPQTTTYDQSYFVDQTDAFIGLGYLQAHAYSW